MAITLLDIVLIHRSGVVQGIVFVVVLCCILYWIGGVYRSMQTLQVGLSRLSTSEVLAFKKLRGLHVVLYVIALCVGVAALRGIVDRVRFDNGGYPIFG